MPDELTERIQRVSGTIPVVDWSPPADIRRSGQRRRRARMAVAVATAVVVTAGAAGALALAAGRQPTDTPGGASTGGTPCTTITGLDPGPPSPADVTVVVVNATGNPDKLDDYVQEFRARSFAATGVNTRDGHDGVAVIRYGPKSISAAWLLRAYLLDRADLVFDPARTAEAVEVLLGRRFKQLATITETNQTLGKLGPPTLPPGVCITS